MEARSWRVGEADFCKLSPTVGGSRRSGNWFAGRLVGWSSGLLIEIEHFMRNWANAEALPFFFWLIGCHPVGSLAHPHAAGYRIRWGKRTT